MKSEIRQLVIDTKSADNRRSPYSTGHLDADQGIKPENSPEMKMHENSMGCRFKNSYVAASKA